MGKSSATFDQAPHILTLIGQRVHDAETLQEFIRRNVEVIFEADPTRFAFGQLKRMVAESVVEVVGEPFTLPPDYCYQDMERHLRSASQEGMIIDNAFINAAWVQSAQRIQSSRPYSVLGITRPCDVWHRLMYMQWLGYKEAGVKELFAYVAHTKADNNRKGLMVAALNYRDLWDEGLVPVAYEDARGLRRLELRSVQSWICDQAVNAAVSNHRAVALAYKLPEF